MEHTFTARLDRVGVNRCVDVPAEVSARLPATAHIPVQGIVEGEPFESTLVPRGAGRHRLFIHSRIWRPRRLDPGSLVEVTLWLDTREREPALPDDLVRTLRAHPGAARAIEGWTTARRRELVAWLDRARKPATRARRIRQLLERFPD